MILSCVRHVEVQFVGLNGWLATCETHLFFTDNSSLLWPSIYVAMLPFTQEPRQRRIKLRKEVAPLSHTHTLSCHVPIWNGFVSCLTILNIHITSHYITRSWSHWCLIAQSFMSVMIFHFCSFHASFSKYIPVLLHFAPEIAEVELWRVIYKIWHYIKAHNRSQQ